MSEENRTNAPEEELTQEDINSLKKIRMDKLEELKAKGKNPFEITKYDVTASCAEGSSVPGRAAFAGLCPPAI